MTTKRLNHLAPASFLSSAALTFLRSFYLRFIQSFYGVRTEKRLSARIPCGKLAKFNSMAWFIPVRKQMFRTHAYPAGEF